MTEEFLHYLNLEQQIPPANRRVWDKWAKKYESARLQLRIDHTSKTKWHMLADASGYGYTGEKKDPKSKEDSIDQINAYIADGQVKGKLEKQTWVEISSAMCVGVYIPLTTVQVLSANALNQWLNLLFIYNQSSEWMVFLKSLNGLAKNANTIGLYTSAILRYLLAYNNILKKHKTSDNEIPLPKLSDILSQYSDLHFPLEQCMHKLLLIIEDDAVSLSTERRSSWHLECKSKSASSFLRDHLDEIILFTQSDSKATKQLEKALMKFGEADRWLYTLQEFIDNQSGLHLIKSLPKSLQDEIQNTFNISIKDRLKNILGERSVLDRIKSATSKDVNNTIPPLNTPILEEENTLQNYWYEISDTIQDKIKTAIDDLPNNKRALIYDQANERFRNKLTNIANIVLFPLFRIEESPNGAILQLNVHDETKATLLTKLHWEKERIIHEEQEILKKLIKQLYQKQYPSEVNQLAKNSAKFNSQKIQEEWDNVWQQYATTLSNRLSYRKGRMVELGILSPHEEVSARKEIWLNEMLKIEEEIKPYVAYVKKAFAAVLPVNTTVDFDPYRHKFDGIEFDPMTILDQRKWLQGDIMHSLRHKSSIGHIEQVNCFCLDYSGSMDHERMRGLFKMLYLLILGLESRKSYDSLHFFSTHFIPTSEFRDGYTNRALMFDILRRVAKIKNHQIEYGGSGGTNISEAIGQCHGKIVTFTNHLRRTDPSIKIASSLFVITDGDPTLGIIDPKELASFVDEKRKSTGVRINGLYLNPNFVKSESIKIIFGEGNYVESFEFDDMVHSFVQMMISTYEQQRKEYRWNEKKKVIKGIS